MDFKVLENKFKTLSHPQRLYILYLLIKANTPLCICELMDALNAPEYKISRYLSALKEAKFINEERDGRLLLFSLNKTCLFNKQIFKIVENIQINKNDNLYEKVKNLNKRLCLRKNNKVVVTYKN